MKGKRRGAVLIIFTPWKRFALLEKEVQKCLKTPGKLIHHRAFSNNSTMCIPHLTREIVSEQITNLIGWVSREIFPGWKAFSALTWEMLPHFRAFENLWKNHRMNKTLQNDNADANCDNDTLDVYTLNEDHLWTTSELEEMKKPKRTQGEKSTVALDKTNNGQGVDCSKRVSRSKGRGSSLEIESRPDFYHGVGPCNDVNLPGVWFFRIPHKVCNNHEIYTKC